MSSELPSQVEETLAICPRFRIVLVGNSGVGKSSLVTSVFNILFNVSSPVSSPDGEDRSGIDISHDRAGRANIEHEYFSTENPRFILHDSMGFEPGSIEKSEIVKSFLKNRAEGKAMLPDQVHAIWLCIETPRTGSRVLQTGDDDLLELAKQLKIPVIMVFTKYDRLVLEHFKASSHIQGKEARLVEATKCAERSFNEATTQFLVPFVRVCVPTKSGPNRQLRGQLTAKTLVELTEVTRNHLHDVGGSLWALWATAQQINARQKVELSISEGFKKYWYHLGESICFEGHTMGTCISRIHDDIIKVWNFNDPAKVLCGEHFLEEMIKLVEPVRVGVKFSQSQQIDSIVDIAANTVTVATAISSSVVLPALALLIGQRAFKFLSNRYQKGTSNSMYLSAYIVDLILVLHEISMATRVDPPKPLTVDIVMTALEGYRSEADEIHLKLKGNAVAFAIKAEGRIATVIRDTLRMSLDHSP